MVKFTNSYRYYIGRKTLIVVAEICAQGGLYRRSSEPLSKIEVKETYLGKFLKYGIKICIGLSIL